MPHVRTSGLPGAAASRSGGSPVRAEEGVELRRTVDGRGDGVLAARPFAAGETVMVGFLIGALTGNDSHATQVAPGRWALHGGLGPMVNHSCDPNCGVRLNDVQAFDFVARRAIDAGAQVTFDYAMRNYTIDHFPAVCLCGAAQCRGSVTGWKDLPAARKAAYGELVAPYLRMIDDDIRRPPPADGAGVSDVVRLSTAAPGSLFDPRAGEPRRHDTFVAPASFQPGHASISRHEKSNERR